ncbi:MAG: protein kinase domain-containing protein [Labedaea sp.]
MRAGVGDELIAGRYRLVAEVGRGAMGVVWQARDERLDRTVAVKQLVLDDARLAMREGRVAAKLRHPHAIMVHDVVEHDGRPCLVMEYFPARSLSDKLAARGVLPAERVAEIGRQVAAALAAAHEAGVVHRDVKPGNVLVAADGTAKLADFGISRAVGDGTLTTGVIAGTPAYLAPEVAGGAPATFASDVFSLGATLYAATEGRPPFGLDDNPIALLHRVAAGEIGEPERSGPLTEVLRWMLRRDPAQRPAMSEVRDVLAAVAGGERPRLPNVPREPTLLLPVRGRWSPRAVGFGALALGLIAVGVVLGTVFANRPVTVTAARSSDAPASATTTTTPNSPCVAEFAVTNVWPGGYQASVVVRNNAGPALAGWTVRWTLPAGQTINTLWNGTLAQNGTAVTVSNAGWNAAVAANGSTEFGLTANAPNGAETPRPQLTCQAPR